MTAWLGVRGFGASRKPPYPEAAEQPSLEWQQRAESSSTLSPESVPMMTTLTTLEDASSGLSVWEDSGGRRGRLFLLPLRLAGRPRS